MIIKVMEGYIRERDKKFVSNEVWEFLKAYIIKDLKEDISDEKQSAMSLYFAMCVDYQNSVENHNNE